MEAESTVLSRKCLVDGSAIFRMLEDELYSVLGVEVNYYVVLTWQIQSPLVHHGLQDDTATISSWSSSSYVHVLMFHLVQRTH